MGGCVSKVMMAKNDGSVVEHKGIKAFTDLPKPLIDEIDAATADMSGIYSRIHKDAASIKAYQESCYATGPLPARFKATCLKYAKQDAIGVRHVDHIEKTTIMQGGKEKKWEYVHYKPTVRHSFTTLLEMVENYGRGLIEIGVTKGMNVGLYEDTRMEWLVSCYGIWCAGGVGVTVYANLGEDALVYAMKEAELTYMFCNGKLVKNLIKLCEAAGVTVPTLIYTDDLPADIDLKGTKAYSFADVIAKGKESKAALVEDHSTEDLGLVMYTSGTTGDPKGVMLTHGNLSAAISLFTARLNLFLPDSSKVTYMAYLPLAHILEFAVENLFLLQGAFVGYGTPRTLTDTTAKPHGDLAEFQPHIIIGVPRVFETIRKGVEAAIPAGLKRRIFDDASMNKLAHLMKGMDTPYLNEKIFNAVRAKLGGRCEVILSGGAPLSAKVHEFLSIVTGATCVQGYGLTETCACITTQLPWDIATETSGCLIEGVELKLRDAGEWSHSDKPFPRGEILVRGPAVTKGYYKQPAMTADAIDKDGWFATGDVGAVDANGNLNIVGRVKALVKNAFGEYVALDALEAVYCLSPIALPNGVCVLVNGQKSFICALVITDEVKTMAFARENNLAGTWPEILKTKAFQDKATASFAEIAKKNKRKPFEVVKKVVVLADEWTPENGILTAAQKLKRREVDKRYATLIEELFAGDE